MKKRILVVLLAAAMLLAGCGNGKDAKTGADVDIDLSSYPIETDVMLSYFRAMPSNAATLVENYGETNYAKEFEKRTGVKIEYLHPGANAIVEALNLMIASDELPDIVEYAWAADYVGGAYKAIKDEVIVPLNDYKEYAPGLFSRLEANDEFDKAAKTDDGNYYGFPMIQDGTLLSLTQGPVVRADWLEELGLEAPETIDDWTAVFAKAKSEGFSRPFTCNIGVLSFRNATINSFNTAYDVGKGLYIEGDDVVFAPFQPGFKEYVAQVAEWTKAGYIDTGFITNDSQKIEANMTNGTSMAAHGYTGSAIGKILPAAQAIDPSYDLVACPFPVAEKGQIAEFQEYYKDASTLAIGISPSCGNYEKAIEWCDYIYSEDGMELQLFGVEGDTYTVEEIDGEKYYTYTEKITNLEENGFTSITEALYHYMLPCNHPGYNQHRDYLNGYYQLDRQKEAIVTWNIAKDNAKEHALPALSYTEEETREYTDILEIAEANLEVAICDIILGKKSIDAYDDAIKQAKEEGYDRYIEIAQGAYERYLSKLNN